MKTRLTIVLLLCVTMLAAQEIPDKNSFYTPDDIPALEAVKQAKSVRVRDLGAEKPYVGFRELSAQRHQRENDELDNKERSRELDARARSIYSADDTKKKLDSIKSKYWNSYLPGDWGEDLIFRADIVYNEHGKETSLIYYEKDTEKDVWVEYSKREWSYTENQEIAEHIFYYWDEEDSEWDPSSKYDHSYDGDGNEIYYARSLWDSDLSTWYISYKYELTFNPEGQRTMFSRYFWDANKGKLSGEFKNEWIYDDAGLVLEFYEHLWDEALEAWAKEFKTGYSYNAEGLLLTDSLLYWDGLSTDWMAMRKTVHTYDMLLLILSETFNWDSSLDSWENDKKTEITYNDENLKSSETFAVWNEYLSQWENASREDYYYDAEGRDTLTMFLYWDPGLLNWQERQKNKRAYDEYGNLVLIITYFWEGYDWIGFTKSEYTFDALGNQLHYARYRGNGLESWIGEYRRDESYDAQGNQLSWTNFIWNDYIMEWAGDQHYTLIYTDGLALEIEVIAWVDGGWEEWMQIFTYNERGLITGMWDAIRFYETGPWQNGNYRTDFSYDEANNSMTEVESYWDEYEEQWYEASKIEYLFNEKDQLLSMTYFSNYGEQGWVENYRRLYSYNNNDELAIMQELYWEYGSSVWINSLKEEYSYDAKGNLTQISEFYWEDSDWLKQGQTVLSYNTKNLLVSETTSYYLFWENRWMDTRMILYLYDEQDRLELETEYSWREEMTTWMDDRKSEYIYVGNGTLAEIIYSFYREDLQIYKKSHKEQLVYDPAYPRESLILPFEYVEEPVFKWGMLLTMSYAEWDSETGTWVAEEEAYQLYYSDCNPISVKDLKEQQHMLGLYPNPATTVLNLGLETEGTVSVSIISLSGALIQELRDINSSLGISLDQLEPGAYIVRVSTVNGTHYGKFLKR